MIENVTEAEVRRARNSAQLFAILRNFSDALSTLSGPPRSQGQEGAHAVGGEPRALAPPRGAAAAGGAADLPHADPQARDGRRLDLRPLLLLLGQQLGRVPHVLPPLRLPYRDVSE